jgi:hypothetical protein
MSETDVFLPTRLRLDHAPLDLPGTPLHGLRADNLVRGATRLRDTILERTEEGEDDDSGPLRLARSLHEHLVFAYKMGLSLTMYW